MGLRYSLLALSLAACGGATSPSYNGGNNPPPPPGGGGGGGTGASVTVASYAFSPSNVTIKLGATVTWTNQDDVAHTVTDDNSSPAFNASLAGAVPDPTGYGGTTGGGTFQYTFTSAGTFHYHCSNHATMAHATVTVNP